METVVGKADVCVIGVVVLSGVLAGIDVMCVVFVDVVVVDVVVVGNFLAGKRS